MSPFYVTEAGRYNPAGFSSNLEVEKTHSKPFAMYLILLVRWTQ